MVMRAKKAFVVIAYDITEDKRRNRVVKVLKKYGRAINMSVYACIV